MRSCLSFLRKPRLSGTQVKSSANRGNSGVLLVRVKRKTRKAEGHNPSCRAQDRTVLSSRNCYGRMYLGSRLGLPPCDPKWTRPSFRRDKRLSRRSPVIHEETEETAAAFHHLQTELSGCPHVLPLSTPHPPQLMRWKIHLGKGEEDFSNVPIQIQGIPGLCLRIR